MLFVITGKSDGPDGVFTALCNHNSVWSELPADAQQGLENLTFPNKCPGGRFGSDVAPPPPTQGDTTAAPPATANPGPGPHPGPHGPNDPGTPCDKLNTPDGCRICLPGTSSVAYKECFDGTWKDKVCYVGTCKYVSYCDTRCGAA